LGGWKAAGGRSSCVSPGRCAVGEQSLSRQRAGEQGRSRALNVMIAGPGPAMTNVAASSQSEEALEQVGELVPEDRLDVLAQAPHGRRDRATDAGGHQAILDGGGTADVVEKAAEQHDSR